MYLIPRRGFGRMFVLLVIVVSVLLCLYYVSHIQTTPSDNRDSEEREAPLVFNEFDRSSQRNFADPDGKLFAAMCPKIVSAKADIDTQVEFDKFDFQPSWTKSREYWDDSFEARYAELRKDPSRPPLKVIIVPNSHTDPGWLKTFEQYFHGSTRSILNNVVTKLTAWPNMTFIWSEVSFLSLWWDSAHPTKKAVVKRLVRDGRLEITTGGWVMTDEATAHVFAMVDQLMEGHQWLKTNLDVSPETGWAVDPFGHGGTMPYLLKAADIQGAVIQRIHYAWKQWFAKRQSGDFIWLQPWDHSGSASLLTHNQPFDIYNIKHSCGPHPHVCLHYDFRKIRGEYTEYSVKAVEINANNVDVMAKQLVEQWAKTGSLFHHNVVLMPLGDDFRYEHPIEWDQQFSNYKILMDYINSHKDEYDAEIVFGTPKDFFNEIKKRTKEFPTLKGDFFVYADIFSEGRPAYWSGYYTTRPYMKILGRELESNLRSAEILYTIALNVAKQSSSANRQHRHQDIKIYETHFEKLVKARRNLGLFQHHDAITGTSKSMVMKDYALKLFESITDMTSLQSFAIQSLLMKSSSQAAELSETPYPAITTLKSNQISAAYVSSESDRDSYEKLAKKIPISLTENEVKKVLVFNSLAQPRQEVVSVKVTTPKVRVLDAHRRPVNYQIAPVMNASSITPGVYLVIWIANLRPLTISTYHLEHTDEMPANALSSIYCNKCANDIKDNIFPISALQVGDVQLENRKMKLLFDGQTGFLKMVTKKSTGKIMQCAIQFAAYTSAQYHSGAYLFMPDPNLRDIDKDILEAYTPHQKIYIISGNITSRLTVEYGKLLSHHVSIYHHSSNDTLSEAIHVRNVVDFETPPKNRETEMFMRIQTDIVNGDPPSFYTDMNGHQMVKRTKIERIGIEGNYYPITTMAYIEDTNHRLTLVVNHAQGAASYQPGWLEVMMDRRTLYDDARGMGEGLLDNRKTVIKHWLLLEDIQSDKIKTDSFSSPSLVANRLSNALNYPLNLYLVDTSDKVVDFAPEIALVSQSFPCDTHLMNLRTSHDHKLPHYPVSSAFLILQRQGYSCSVKTNVAIKHCPLVDRFSPATTFYRLEKLNVTRTSLTGTKNVKILKNALQDIRMQPMEIQTYNLNFVY